MTVSRDTAGQPRRHRLWAGRIRDPFFIDLDQLATVNDAFKNGAKLDRSAWRPENAKNSFAGTTVESIVLEVTRQESMLRDEAQIGVWCRTMLATDAGGWRQINRAGHPTPAPTRSLTSCPPDRRRDASPGQRDPLGTALPGPAATRTPAPGRRKGEAAGKESSNNRMLGAMP